MGEPSWPSKEELGRVKRSVAEIAGGGFEDVRVVVSPYRICPLGAHIDHQGGAVLAMTINKGILLGFIPSGDTKVLIRSGQFEGEVRFRIDEIQHPRCARTNDTVHENDSSRAYEECKWGNYVRGALYALQQGGKQLYQIFLPCVRNSGAWQDVRKSFSSYTHFLLEELCKGFIGFICGSKGLDSSGLSSSAAVGVACLLAFQSANNLTISPAENIELDRLIENGYLGLRNGILDQSAILLSSYGCLTYMDCKTKKHTLIYPPKLHGDQEHKGHELYKILLAFSGLKHALTNSPGYNCRVSECQEAASILLSASSYEKLEPLLCNVEPDIYEAHKGKLAPNLSKRAEHYFSENIRVMEGKKAWASGNLEDFGKLISASGLSSIQNYECGCEPLIQLYKILLRAPGVFGARFSGAGFRGCCIALVATNHAKDAAYYVEEEYRKVQPKLTSLLEQGMAVLVCDSGTRAHVI